MSRLQKLWSAVRKSGRCLVALCYAAFLLGTVLLVLFGMAEDGVRRLVGDVQTIEISGERTDAFLLYDLEQEGNRYTALSGDPRMELELSQLSSGRPFVYVRRVTLYLEEMNMEPGEVCVFYKTKPDMEEYDAIDRVWAHRDAEHVYSFTLPGCRLYGIRIDPGIFAGLRFRLERVVLNEPRSLPSRLTPTRPYLLALAVAPLLAASALHWMFRAWELSAERRRKKSKQSAALRPEPQGNKAAEGRGTDEKTSKAEQEKGRTI